MNWVKKGLLFAPNKDIWWQQTYGMLPTPYYIESQGILRIYFSTACSEKFGRITYMDVDPYNPSQIIQHPKHIILDIGEPGTFDDCGLIPTCIIKIEGKYHLYYSGYQRHYKVPYSILSGVAISDDGINFTRQSKVPFLERTNNEMNIRSAPFIIYQMNTYHMWYTAGNGWKKFDSGLFAGRTMPTYLLKYAFSSNGLDWTYNDEPIFKLEKDEFGISRPYVIKKDGGYDMYYSIRSGSEPYKLGYATSANMMNWFRRDADIGINVSDQGWDNEMLCYPAVISIQGKTYLFYNGNKNGETGFGYAELG